MAYDKALAERVRATLIGQDGMVEKSMFGGVAFMVGGNICCGIINDELMVRVGTDAHEAALQQPNVRNFDLTGRSMKGWVVVTAPGVQTGESLASWVQAGLAFAKTLPVK